MDLSPREGLDRNMFWRAELIDTDLTSLVRYDRVVL